MKPSYHGVFEKFKVWGDGHFLVQSLTISEEFKVNILLRQFIFIFLFNFYLFYVKGKSIQKKNMCLNACICIKIHALKN